MTEARDYLELTFRSINCFADDGKLDVQELDSLISIALRDGVVDDNEKRVLQAIIGRLNQQELTEEMQARIKQIQNTYF